MTATSRTPRRLGRALLIRRFGGGRVPFGGAKGRRHRARSVADGLAAVTTGLHHMAVRKDIQKQLQRPVFLKRVESKMQRRADWGVLIVIRYHTAMTHTGRRYKHIVVYDGPAAPSMPLAVQWDKTGDHIATAPINAQWKLEHDYIWLTKDRQIRRGRDVAIPDDACVVTQQAFEW